MGGAGPRQRYPYPAFFSYAHAKGGSFDDKPNDPYRTFFTDICSILYHLALFSEDVAFTDTSMRNGDDFPEVLYQRLSQFRVFVPVLSRTYFESPWCGREWAAYEKRCKDSPDRSVRPIVPILWTGRDSLDLPEWFTRQRLYEDSTFDPLYGQHGVYGLQRAYDEVYKQTVYALAAQIAKAVDTSLLALCDPGDLRRLNPRFGGDDS